MTIQNISRRSVLLGAGSGALVLSVSLPLGGCTPAGVPEVPVGKSGSLQPLAYFTLNTDGTVTIIAHRSEMGQGIKESLPAVVADEMGADWSRVAIRQADGDESVYGSQNTDGSRSVRQFYTPMRQVGAMARTMLEEAAAEQWGVPAAEVKAINHVVRHESSGRELGFGDLAAAASQRTPPPVERLTLKPDTELRYVGQTFSMPDLDDMTTGKALYGADIKVPGMKYAAIARPPVWGGRIASFDDSAARAVKGVEKTIRLPDGTAHGGFAPLGGVAVIASSTWAAFKGVEALSIEWDNGANADWDTAAYATRLTAAARSVGEEVRVEGNAGQALDRAAKTVQADYFVPHLAHAQMEPPVALASFSGGKVEIWAPTQHPQNARQAVADTLSIPVEDVTVHVTLLGGGFGRKSKPDFIVEAALLAKEAGAPVRLQWSREDDIRHDYYHTMAAQSLQGGLDEDGRTIAWMHTTAFPSISATFNPKAERAGDGELGLGFTDLPFEIPNIRLAVGSAAAHTRIGWFRSVCNIQHAFAISSFADELAHAAGRDPKDYLIELLGSDRRVDLSETSYPNYGEDPARYPVDTARLKGVVDLAAERAGWGRSLPAGRGLGIAAHRSFASYVAVVAEVEVGGDGTLTVHKFTMAVDAGLVVNPDRAVAQMEGSAVMGQTLALYGEITASGGRIEQSNYSDFEMVRIDTAPRAIDVHIVESDGLPGGIGEPGLPPVAPALTNAIFAATGKRIRRLPIREQLKV